MRLKRGKLWTVRRHRIALSTTKCSASQWLLSANQRYF